MAYASGNPRTKKQLREQVLSGKAVFVFWPGLGGPSPDHIEYLEGPHYPETHRWCARVKTDNNHRITEVLR